MAWEMSVTTFGRVNYGLNMSQDQSSMVQHKLAPMGMSPVTLGNSTAPLRVSVKWVLTQSQLDTFELAWSQQLYSGTGVMLLDLPFNIDRDRTTQSGVADVETIKRFRANVRAVDDNGQAAKGYKLSNVDSELKPAFLNANDEIRQVIVNTVSGALKIRIHNQTPISPDYPTIGFRPILDAGDHDVIPLLVVSEGGGETWYEYTTARADHPDFWALWSGAANDTDLFFDLIYQESRWHQYPVYWEAPYNASPQGTQHWVLTGTVLVDTTPQFVTQ